MSANVSLDHDIDAKLFSVFKEQAAAFTCQKNDVYSELYFGGGEKVLQELPAGYFLGSLVNKSTHFQDG